jgi:hypothetical protein
MSMVVRGTTSAQLTLATPISQHITYHQMNRESESRRKPYENGSIVLKVLHSSFVRRSDVLGTRKPREIPIPYTSHVK